MKTSAILSVFGLCATLASAHMEMIYPPPFRSKVNDHATTKDFDMTSPLSADGSNFPCKGYHSDFGTPAGASTATFAPGQSYKFTISGGASHNGGSCQASLSYDKGKTWTVIHSYIGNCPLQGESDFDFAIPADTPDGEAIFSWSWFNKVGNREMYQNCAAVTIGGGGSKNKKRADSFKSRPAMFVANTGDGCSTVEGKDLEFPNPGPDVTNDSQGTAPPSGSCAGGSGGGSGGGDEGGNDGGNDGGNESAPTDGAGSAPAEPSTPSEGNEPNPGIPSQGAPNPGIPTQPAEEAPAQPTTAPSAEQPSATVPGGVFITSPPEGGDESAAPAPTTLITMTNPVVPPVETPGTPDVQEPPAETPGAPDVEEPPSTPAPTPGNGSGDVAGAQPAGEACTNEGDWNCVNGGTQFQRCASGQWSVLISMAAGTSCEEGMGASFALAKSRRDRAVRFARSLRF
jgi:hypothetical protein